jgi:hypothetical protein
MRISRGDLLRPATVVVQQVREHRLWAYSLDVLRFAIMIGERRDVI